MQGAGFVDENGDGINDLAPDADGDGIPNGMDEDYVPSGNAQGKNGNNQGKRGLGFVDEDGDGISDLAMDSDGDGIINCEDEDFVRQSASGSQAQKGSMGRGMRGNGFKQASQPAAGNTGNGQRGGRAPQSPQGDGSCLPE